MSYGEVLAKLMEMAEKSEKMPAEMLAAQGEGRIREKKKQIIIKICPDCAERKVVETKSRNVPISIKRLVLARQNNRCNRAYCTHPLSELHHINGYALTKNHSSEGLEYLCEKHHKIAHAQHDFVQIYRGGS